jgi:hypothetical protein
MAQVFVSYAREDGKDYPPKIREELRDEFDVWFDEDIRLGRRWKPEIDQEIKKSFAVLLAVTEEIAKSHYVGYEIGFARGLEKPIYPLITDLIADPADFLRQVAGFTGGGEEQWAYLTEENSEWGKIRSCLRKDFAESDVGLSVSTKERLENLRTRQASGDLINELAGLIEDYRHYDYEPPVIEAILEKLDHPDSNVVIKALQACQCKGVVESVPQSIDLLKPHPDYHYHVQVAAAYSLGAAGSSPDLQPSERTSAVATLNDVFNPGQQQPDLVNAILWAMRKIPDPCYMEKLLRYMAETPPGQYSENLFFALSKIDDERVIPCLLKALLDPNTWRHALPALAKRGTRDAAKAIRDALVGMHLSAPRPTPQMRTEFEQTLIDMGYPPGSEEFEELGR